MITFKKIRYKNFLSSGNQFTEIDFQQHHTNLIIGTNGAGKSTILDALTFVLFNKPFLPSTSLDDPPPFDFRAEMHETRVRADELLAEGKIEEAETYMEAQRQIFWQNGYLLRKLNQAYFAFHGAYADVPGGAAGEDPVGPAVRALRAQSTSLKDFINTIARMTSFEQLQQAIQE